ncbi:MAG: hypothetical protein M1830_002365 [Pleopsidium flavum]|nr:MAG: hypothetical protein M1830_002365 [Pleopsidium flavum]
MEKLKNIINPGSKKDDEVMYGSGQSSDPVHSANTGGVSGQGSHFGSSQRGTDPLSSSTNPTSSGVGSGSGYGSEVSGTGRQPGLSGNTTSRSNMPGGFDDGASTASIKSGVPGYPQSGSGLAGSSATGDSLDTNKPLPHTPGSGLTGSNTTTGPHSSNLANKADPRVDSDLDGSRGLGRGTTGAGLTGTNLPDRSVESPNNGSSHLGRDAAMGTGVVGAAGLGERERYGDQFTTNTGVGSGTTGSGIGSGIRGYGQEAWEHNHHQHGHRYEGDPCSHGAADSAGPHFTAGPHATDTANRLDPHVAGGDGALEGTTETGPHGDSPTGSGIGLTGTGPGIGSTGTGAGIGSTGIGSGISATSTGYDNRGGDRHLGRDATLAGGVGTAGVGAYEAGQHHHGRSDPVATSAGTTAGLSSTGNSNPYGSSAVDPRVDSTPRSGMIGTGNDKHFGRDAGVAGVGGLTAYEAEKHHHGRDEPGRKSGLSGTTAGTTGRDYDSTRGSFASGNDSQTTTGHHHGRDAGLAGAGAVGGAEFSKQEAEKHRKEESKEENHDGKKHGGLFGFLHRDKDPKEYGSASHSSHGSHHGSHHGTEAAGVGAAGAGTAAYEYEKHDHDRNRLHKDPPEGYASQVTGGTGTTSLAQGESVQSGSHASGLGNKLDPNIAGRGDSLGPGEVIEPHTGLPMNVGKYGSGAGGTDDTPVPGFHNH